MKKGSIFLLLALLLLAGVLILISAHPDHVVTQQSAWESPTQECSSDSNCLSQAMSNGCQKAHFQIPSPFNDTCYLSGLVMGKSLSKCYAIIENPDTGDLMACYLDAPPPTDVTQYRSFESSCSGTLLEKITAAA